MRIPDDFSSRVRDRGGEVHLQAHGGRYKALLVVFVLVVNAGEKTHTFSYEKNSLHVNHYLKNNFDGKTQRILKRATAGQKKTTKKAYHPENSPR